MKPDFHKNNLSNMEYIHTNLILSSSPSFGGGWGEVFNSLNS